MAFLETGTHYKPAFVEIAVRAPPLVRQMA